MGFNCVGYQYLWLCKCLVGTTFHPNYVYNLFFIALYITFINSEITSKRQHIIVAIAIHILAVREQQVIFCSIILLFQLCKFTCTVILEEHRIGIACAIEWSRECYQYIHIAVFIKVVTIHIWIDLNILIQQLCVKFALAAINHCLQFCSRIDKVLYCIAIQICHHYRSRYIAHHPLAIAYVIINHTIFFIHKVHHSVGIQI